MATRKSTRRTGEGAKRGATRNVLGRYRYAECGLNNVYLKNVERVRRGDQWQIRLRAVPMLQRVIGACLAYKPVRLAGEEIRFIRSVLGYAGQEFAALLSVRPETLSRIECGHEPVSRAVDKLVRLRVVLDLLRHDDLASRFDLDDFEEIIDREVPQADRDLALFLDYRGPAREGSASPMVFEFRQAA